MGKPSIWHSDTISRDLEKLPQKMPETGRLAILPFRQSGLTSGPDGEIGGWYSLWVIQADCRTTTLMDAHDVFLVMTVQAPPHAKDHASKKDTGKKSRRGTTALNALAEYSLTGFLEEEPDIYAVSDIKVRYR